MIRAIIFDCGGVLVYPKGGYWQRAVDRDAILNGRRLDFDADKAASAFRKYAYILDEGQLISGLNHEKRLRCAFLKAMNEELQTGLSEREMDALAHSLTYNDARYQLYDDSLQGIDRLSAEYRIGFLSNAMPSMVRALNNTGLTEHLDCFTVSCLIGCQKPEKRMYLTALDELQLPPEECVFVEDLKENLLAAAKLGMNVIRMKRPFYYCVPVADFDWPGDCARDLSEVEQLVRAHNSGQRDIRPCGA